MSANTNGPVPTGTDPATIDLTNLSPDMSADLSEVVHAQASVEASDTVNAGDNGMVAYLIEKGWSEQDIKDRLALMADGQSYKDS